MVRRPFKYRRPIGPFILKDRDTDVVDHETRDQEVDTINADPHFESLDDLPDSPMLMEYIEKQAKYFNRDPEEIINSPPVKDYMRRLGVWEQAVKKNI